MNDTGVYHQGAVCQRSGHLRKRKWCEHFWSRIVCARSRSGGIEVISSQLGSHLPPHLVNFADRSTVLVSRLCDFSGDWLADSCKKKKKKKKKTTWRCIPSGDISLQQPWVKLALGLWCSQMQLWFMSHAVEPLSPTLFVKVVCLLNAVIFIDVFPSRVPKYVIRPCFKFSSPTRAVYYDRQAGRL